MNDADRQIYVQRVRKFSPMECDMHVYKRAHTRVKDNIDELVASEISYASLKKCMMMNHPYHFDLRAMKYISIKNELWTISNHIYQVGCKVKENLAV